MKERGQGWLLEAIDRVARGESDVLHLSRIASEFELPPSAMRLDGLRILSLDACPNFRWPTDTSGWPSLERIRVRAMPFPPTWPWVSEVDLDLEWSAFRRHREFIDPERVRGLRFGSADRWNTADWCFSRIDTLDIWDVRTDTREALLRLVSDRHAPQMKQLFIRGCDRWPNSICDMTGLTGLVVYGGPPQLGISLARFPELRILGLVASGVDSLPDSSRHWPPKLERLYLHGNNLTHLPTAIGQLKRLRQLTLSQNRFTSVPQALRDHQSLASLSIIHNPVTDIPKWLFTLPELESLSIASSLTFKSGWTLPVTVLNAHKLEHLDIAPHDFDTPPPEVVAQGLSAIKTYWRQREGEEQAFLSEAKLLIVGEAGAGKTTLARRLSDPQATMPGDDESTEGIEVGRWGINGYVRCEGKTLPQWIDINIWDFGGQEIYHATHQFFLSQRAVYVLVTDGRREDTDFHYWLRAVDLFGQGSPVLIVLNEHHGRTWEIDVDRWRKRFPSLVGAITADLSKPDHVRRVHEAIEGQILSLKHLSTPFPASWRQVRDSLESRRRSGVDHITLDDYLNICHQHGFRDREDKLVLARFLHDIGICLHFQDVQTLLKTVILEPEWGTDAVYRVLDHRPIVDARGRFTDTMLADTWSEDRYNHMHAELLALMQRFRLCYPLAGGRGYIAPQLLGRSQPDYRLPRGSVINLRYQYSFMPKGIVTRFIVATHDLISDQRHVWRSGVILKRREAWCEVIEDYPGREITVRVVGEDTKPLLAIVDRELERIHDGFKPALDYQTLVPCNCKRHCIDSDDPMLFSHSTLVRYAVSGEAIKCDRSFAEIDPQTLLDGALPERSNHQGRAVTLRGMTQGSHDSSPQAVFVSYSWDHLRSVELVDQLQTRCKAAGIDFRRDAKAVRYKESFQRFMDQLGTGRCVIIVLSPAYFKSTCCMYELLSLSEHPDFIERVYPVIADPDVFGRKHSLAAELYWQDEYAEFNSMMQQLDQERARAYDEDLAILRKIRDGIGRLHGLLADLNALPDVVHGDAPFFGIMAAIRERIESVSRR